MREWIAAWAAEKSAVPEGSANLIADREGARMTTTVGGISYARAYTRAGVSPCVGTDNSTVIITELGSLLLLYMNVQKRQLEAAGKSWWSDRTWSTDRYTSIGKNFSLSLSLSLFLSSYLPNTIFIDWLNIDCEILYFFLERVFID